MVITGRRCGGGGAAPGPGAPATGGSCGCGRPSASTKSRPNAIFAPIMRKKFGVTLAEATCSAVPSSLGKSPRKVVTAVNSSNVLLAELRKSRKQALENGK